MSDDGEEEQVIVAYERLLEADMRFECMECGKRFYHKSNLSNHMRTHADRSGFTCDACCKVFYSEAQLHDHSRLEHDELVNFVCHLCRKTFPQKSHLKSHLATHSADAPYTCELCGQAFPKRIRLRHHYRSHVCSTKRKRPCTARVSRPQQGSDSELPEMDSFSGVVQID